MMNDKPEKLNVALGARSYEILTGRGLIREAGQYIAGFVGSVDTSGTAGISGGAGIASTADTSGSAGSADTAGGTGLTDGTKVCVISDENVWNLHGASLCGSLEDAGVRYVASVIPAGEASKSMERLTALYDWFGSDAGLTRDGLVVAFGGGVVGDLAGFAAATWMRGVRCIQIPTTLLAMVDSSVGGKTAIDTARGKNLVGAFHQPSLVLIDPDMTETLPAREYSAGLAEVIKYGAIASEKLFVELEAGAGNSESKSDIDLPDIIHTCCALKSEIVAEDEYDTGRRAILNFGHTFGHAIEAKYGFEKYNHGEAVAAGMRIAASVGERLGVTEEGTAARLGALLDKEELPAVAESNHEDLISYIKKDKKAGADHVNLILLTRIGQAVTYRIGWDELSRVL